MVKPGDVIEHPITGERITFYKTAEDTEGELLQFEIRVRPHGFVAPEHVHPGQQERFQVLSGTLSARINGQNLIAIPGHSFAIPPGMPHAWWNSREEELRVLVEFRPALRTEAMFESCFALAQAGKVDPRNGRPSVLDKVVMAREFRAEMRPIWPPRVLQPLLFGLIAPLGRLFGRQPRHQYRQVKPPLPLTLPAQRDEHRLSAPMSMSMPTPTSTPTGDAVLTGS